MALSSMSPALFVDWTSGSRQAQPKQARMGRADELMMASLPISVTLDRQSRARWVTRSYQPQYVV
jgi:hypothetical protein